MEVFQTIILKYLLGFGLQSFAIVFGIYTFNREKINIKSLLLSSFLMTILSALVRFLPISIGVHTIVNMLLLYLVCTIIIRMSAYTTIRSITICVVLIILCEMLVSSIILMSKGTSYLDGLMSESLSRALLGDLSNMIFTLIIAITYFVLKKKGENDRKVSV